MGTKSLGLQPPRSPFSTAWEWGAGEDPKLTPRTSQVLLLFAPGLFSTPDLSQYLRPTKTDPLISFLPAEC